MATVVVVGAFAPIAAPAGEARTDDRSKPIVYVHGFDPTFAAGYDCNGYWDTMADGLEGFGQTGRRVTIAYYYLDRGCAQSLAPHGSHSAHHPGGHAFGGHTRDTSIRHLGYHLAWTIHDLFTARGQPVDVVGHSMGGLIARYALAGVATGQPGFPPRLLVEDAVTLGTPHAGTAWAYGCAFVECLEMRPGSSLLGWLAGSAGNPMGTGGTDWTVIGSEDDGIVSAGSAVAMSAPHRAKYRWYMGIDHVDYMLDTSGGLDSDIWREDWNDGRWYGVYDAPHVVRFTDFAFLRSSW